SPGISRSPHPSSSLHFPTGPLLPQSASSYFPHTAIRYPPHLVSQDPLQDLRSLACDPSNQQPSPVSSAAVASSYYYDYYHHYSTSASTSSSPSSTPLLYCLCRPLSSLAP